MSHETSKVTRSKHTFCPECRDEESKVTSHGHTIKIESESFKNWEEFEKLERVRRKNGEELVCETKRRSANSTRPAGFTVTEPAISRLRGRESVR